ncbi:hypothetical protein DRQ23_03170 [bacterium]|nr:MAG: hypothetical protein DRQ23_03170 [bacterium]
MLKRLSILSLLFVPFMLNLSAYEDGDEEFFTSFHAPDVLIILDSSGSMSWNMNGSATYGDGTVGGDFYYRGHLVPHPFYGYAHDWYGSGQTQRYGDLSRMHIVKAAMETTLVRISGTFRWGLATFYQRHRGHTSTWYRAWYYDRRWRTYYPDVQWQGTQTTYAVDQCMIRVPISNAQGQNQSHINQIMRLLDSQINNLNDQNEMRADGGTPIAPALRGARYWYKNFLWNDNARWCRNYNIVLLTDGEPTYGIDPSTYTQGENARMSGYDGSSPLWMRRQCFWEAESLQHIHIPAQGNHPAQDVAINVYVVGIGMAGSATLDSIAYYGGTDSALFAGSPREVAEALEQVFWNILQRAYAFSSAQVTSVEEEFLSTQYENRIYLASFIPGNKSIWEGHLYALRLTASSFSLDSIPDSLLIWDAGDQLRNHTYAVSRNIYGVKNGTLLSFNASNFDSSDLDVDSQAAVDTIVSYVKSGKRVMTSSTKGVLGDIFHSTPLKIHVPNAFYEDDDFWKFRVHMRQSRPFFIITGANDGMIHCFNDSTGREMWAVIPNNLLPKLKNLLTSHEYYVDASPMGADIWFPSAQLDTFKDWTEWKTVVMIGQRGGGRAYTSLDVTNPYSPHLLFEVNHDSLAYTWSDPVMYKIQRLCKISSTDTVERFFAFFGGGYWPDTLWDDLQDPGDIPGNHIFALDIFEFSQGDTDEYVMIPPSGTFEMKWPFPAQATVFNKDPDNNNFYDYLYIGDMYGQVWKVDMTDPNYHNWEARIIFKAPEPDNGNDYENWQPIFYPITVYVKNNIRWLLFGTGDRANPFREGTENRFYAVIDTTPSSGSYITESQLKRVSNSGVLQPTEIMHPYRGWYVVFDDYAGDHDGEKVVTYATVFIDTIMFMTFTPTEVATNDSCAMSTGTARLYKYLVNSGWAYAQPWEDVGGGIPQAPRFNFSMDGEGLEVIQTSDSLIVKQTQSLGSLRKILWWKEY